MHRCAVSSYLCQCRLLVILHFVRVCVDACVYPLAASGLRSSQTITDRFPVRKLQLTHLHLAYISFSPGLRWKNQNILWPIALCHNCKWDGVRACVCAYGAARVYYFCPTDHTHYDVIIELMRLILNHLTNADSIQMIQCHRRQLNKNLCHEYDLIAKWSKSRHHIASHRTSFARDCLRVICLHPARLIWLNRLAVECTLHLRRS